MVGNKAPGRTDPMDSVNEEDHVMNLAETTEVSPQQARDLLKRFGGDYELAKKEAKNFRAES